MFCVYVTFYSGERLPPFYVGSSSVKRVQNGYHGTVKSKRFGSIWREELKINPSAFDTLIIATFDTRLEATEEELRVQRRLRVVEDQRFINEAYATVNGFYTMEKNGERNPMFGRKHTDETKAILSAQAHTRDMSGERNPMFGKPGPKSMLNRRHTDEARVKMSQKQQARLDQNNHWLGVKGKDHPAFGFKHSEDFINSQKVPKPKITCPHCQKSGGKPAMLRFHFEHCKSAR